MANPEHVEIVKQGAEAIHEWRRKTPVHSQFLDLTGADFRNDDLRDVNLFRANAKGADFSEADLQRATLILLSGENASFRNARLDVARLSGAHLPGADLRGAHLPEAWFSKANCKGADFRGAVLLRTYLGDANLWGADFRDASFRFADLRNATVGNADFKGCEIGWSVFGASDLSEAKSLESVIHVGPSTVGIDALYKSRGKIPDVFLRGCGVPDELIAHLPSLLNAQQAIQFYSCFISHSTADEGFATRLHNDFQAAGIRCWKWDHDAKTGRDLWGEIDKAIRVHDKLVLVASKSSLTSPAVNREIERAILQEDERETKIIKGELSGTRDVLFPVRLDDFIFQEWEHARKIDVTKKVIADARDWDSDPAKYKRMLEKLIQDLKPDAIT